MEDADGFWYSYWQFAWLLPYFIVLLVLGIIKGIICCPIACVIITLGNVTVILGLWPLHFYWTYYCVLSAKSLGPILKLVACPCILLVLLFWPVSAIVTSVIGGATYGFLSPLFATFDAAEEGKKNEIFHCFYDGTWSTIQGCCNCVKGVKDICYNSYLSFMDDLQIKWLSEDKKREIRVLRFLVACIATLLGVLIDVPVISIVAICKSPYMLLKGLKRLLHDLIVREGPFMETICIPFAGLAILLWPLAVVTALLCSIIASFFFGAYAGVVAYTESSLLMGFNYITASLHIYDKYSNDMLDMPEGSCFPRPFYGKLDWKSENQSQKPSLSRADSYQNTPVQSSSVSNVINEFEPLEALENFFKEFQRIGESLVSEGMITLKDIEDAQSSQGGNHIINIGLPAYCILRILTRSAKANSSGLLLSDDLTEITTTNQPKDTFFDWFLSPLLILRDQIAAINLSDAEENYLSKLLLSNGNSDRFKDMYTGVPPESELKCAELEALSRRLCGITKSISRYPTYRSRYESLKKTILEELSKKDGMKKPPSGSSNRLARVLSKRKIANCDFFERESSVQQTESDIELQ